MKRSLIIAGAALLAAIAWAAVFAWRSPPLATAPPELASLRAPRIPNPGGGAPFYVYQAGDAAGAILMFGAEHTTAPEHPAVAEMERAWNAFEPTVALVEGRLGFLLPGLMDPVRTYGESGQAARLAKRAGVPLFSWEPPRQAEIDAVAAVAGRERAAAFFIARPLLATRRRGAHDDPEARAAKLIAERGAWPGLDGAIADVSDLDRVWREAVPDGPDWRDATDEHGWPEAFQEAAVVGGHVRDDHMLQLAVGLARNGERVFVVAGSGHALKLEGALAAALGDAD